MKKIFDIYKVPIINKENNWREVEEPLAYEYMVEEQMERSRHPRIIDTKVRNWEGLFQ